MWEPKITVFAPAISAEDCQRPAPRIAGKWAFGVFCEPMEKPIPPQKAPNTARRSPFSFLAHMLTLFALITMSACGQTPISEPVPATSTSEALPEETAASILTAEVSATPEPTPTINIETLPASEVARLLAEGKIEYPAHWEDGKKSELAVAIAEYLNNAAADEVRTSITLSDGTVVPVGWAPQSKRWLPENVAQEPLDFAGETLPPLIVSGFTNAEGQEIIIDPVTGEQRIAPKINLPLVPGFEDLQGEKSITELYALGESKLRDYVMALMLSTSLPDPIRQYIEAGKQTHFPLPVIIHENTKESDRVYNIDGGRQDKFAMIPTNSVLFPIFDTQSKQILIWLNVQQGTAPNTNSFAFSQGAQPTWKSTGEMGQFFGSDTGDSFGILFPGNTTEITYDIYGARPILEGGQSIGSEQEIRQLLKARTIPELVSIIEEIRLLALRPGQIIYEDK